jgi:glycosyltransferase involved in cell wall biosynthesis
MDEPKVTIVVPSWRQGAFVGDCVASILAQDHPNVEILVFDNVSDDGSGHVLSRFDDPRLRVFVEHDRGQADAIRKGLDLATGELFGWLNADDYLPQGAVRASVEVRRQMPAATILYGLVVLVDEAGRFIQVCVPREVTRPSLLEGTAGVQQPGSLYPTATVRAVGGVDPSLHMCMDLDLWLRLLEHGEATFVPAISAFMRVHSGAKTFRLPIRNGIEHVSVAVRRGAPLSALPRLLLGLGVATLKQIGVRQPPVLRRADEVTRAAKAVICRPPKTD